MYERIERLLTSLSIDLHERDEAIRLGLLAAVAGESMFLLGPPGVGKSLVARRLQQAFHDASVFSYLMGRFSTPDEVFGPLSIRKLRDDDKYERTTDNYLPSADVVFLDEIWKASPPIQNALLTALNERLFRNGTREVQLPLKVFVGASNELPEDPRESAAFWDRFLIRLVVEPVEDKESFRTLIQETGNVYRDVVPDHDRLTDDELGQLRERSRDVTLPDRVLELIDSIRVRLASGDDDADPVYVSDRRWKKIANILRAAAALHGRDSVEPLDCALIGHCAWSTEDDREFVDRVVREEMAVRASGSSECTALDDRFASLRERHRSESTATREHREEVPTWHRGEYYRVVESDANRVDTDGAGAEDSGQQILVWHGEFDDLPIGTERRIDLFRYDSSGQLVRTEEADARRTDRWTLLVAGTSYRVETEERVVSTEAETALTGTQREQLRTAASELSAEVRSALAGGIDEQQRLDSEAQRHLFVPAVYVGIIVESIASTCQRLAELELRIDEFIQSLTEA